MGYAYDQSFMVYTARSSEYAAGQIVPILQEIASVKSVLDIGCAFGTWLRVWHDKGTSVIHGVDGTYVSPSELEIPHSCFTAAELADPFDLGRSFDFVQSLEVGEHIRREASETFVETITRHAKGVVAFSAAVPGQGGEYHVNERPLDFWRGLFRERGYHAFDFVRPRIGNDPRISFWYRFNTLIYVHESMAMMLPEAVRRTRIPDDVPVPDVSPPLFRVRKAAVKLLPYRVQHGIARLKARLLPTGRI